MAAKKMTNKPTANKPTANKPTAKKPTAKKPTVRSGSATPPPAPQPPQRDDAETGPGTYYAGNYSARWTTPGYMTRDRAKGPDAGMQRANGRKVARLRRELKAAEAKLYGKTYLPKSGPGPKPKNKQTGNKWKPGDGGGTPTYDYWG